jgi:hypothetical protein
LKEPEGPKSVDGAELNLVVHKSISELIKQQLKEFVQEEKLDINCCKNENHVGQTHAHVKQNVDSRVDGEVLVKSLDVYMTFVCRKGFGYHTKNHIKYDCLSKVKFLNYKTVYRSFQDKTMGCLYASLFD